METPQVTVLAVDDEKTTLILLEQILVAHNFKVKTALSGTDALILLEMEPTIDAILLDIMMPGLDGFEVLEIIKGNPDTAKIPVIMLTATDQIGDKVKAFSAGATDYITKPFQTAELLARLQNQIDLKRATASVLAQEHKYRSLFEKYQMLAENINDLIARLDSDGVFNYVSQASLSLLGFSPEQINGQSFFEFVHAEDRFEIESLSPPLFHTRQSTIVVLRFINAGGESIWLEWNLNPLNLASDESDKPGEFIAIGRDVTERKKYESALQEAYHVLERRVEERTRQLRQSNEQLKVEIEERKRIEAILQEERAGLAQRVTERTAELSAANEELSRAMRLKDEFLASMSHELRTPLNAVLGMSEALLEEIYGPTTGDQQMALRAVESSGRHLLSLINDILDLSKIEAGKVELGLDPVSVQVLCYTSLQFIERAAHKKTLQIDADLPTEQLVIVGDERRLKQILINLLNNAVKFTPDGGKIGLTVKAHPAEKCIDFTIWDTGIGIPSEKISQLFQPFVQLDSRLARQYEGTGLGLALVQRMVKLHGGSVAVESEPDHGSRFTVTLPWNPDQSLYDIDESLTLDNALLERTPVNRPTTEPHILLVEDNEINITTFSAYLERKKYKVSIVRNGLEAISQAKAVNPDLILMDIQMPAMDGLEAIGHIRADESLAGTPIIALTALAMAGDKEKTLSAGANAYLSKPVSLKTLHETIALYLP